MEGRNEDNNQLRYDEIGNRRALTEGHSALYDIRRFFLL